MYKHGFFIKMFSFIIADLKKKFNFREDCYENLKVGRKMTVLIVTMLFLLSGTLAAGLINSKFLQQAINKLYEERLRSSLFLGDFRGNARILEEMLLAASHRKRLKVKKRTLKKSRNTFATNRGCFTKVTNNYPNTNRTNYAPSFS